MGEIPSHLTFRHFSSGIIPAADKPHCGFRHRAMETEWPKACLHLRLRVGESHLVTFRHFSSWEISTAKTSRCVFRHHTMKTECPKACLHLHLRVGKSHLVTFRNSSSGGNPSNGETSLWVITPRYGNRVHEGMPTLASPSGGNPIS